MSKSGFIFSGTRTGRAEYGDMFEAIAHFETPNSMVYQVDFGNNNSNFVRISIYWRPAQELEKDLFYNGIRNMNEAISF